AAQGRRTGREGPRFVRRENHRVPRGSVKGGKSADRPTQLYPSVAGRARNPRPADLVSGRSRALRLQALHSHKPVSAAGQQHADCGRATVLKTNIARDASVLCLFGAIARVSASSRRQLRAHRYAFDQLQGRWLSHHSRVQLGAPTSGDRIPDPRVLVRGADRAVGDCWTAREALLRADPSAYTSGPG